MEIVAADGATATLVGVDFVDPVSFGENVRGSGGMGNDSGGGGAGNGGTVHLVVDGGTIGFDGHPVEIVFHGVAGGGATLGETTRGSVIAETTGRGDLPLGTPVIRANGAHSGRAALRTAGKPPPP